MNRRAWITCTAVAGAVGGSWCATRWVSVPSGADGHRAAPVVVLPTTYHDLGIVDPDDLLEASFTVRNEGNRRLVLRRLSGGCCGENQSDKSIIVPPGGSTELVTTGQTGIRTGRVVDKVAYATNDPARPHFELVLSANVRQ